MAFDYEKSVWGKGNADLRWSSPTAFRLRQALLALRKIPAGGRVLEVGCGAGQFIRAVKKNRRDLDCYGCDISAASIEEAWSEMDGVRYLVSEEKKLPYESDSFDAVIIMDVLEHVVDPSSLMAEIRRILKKGGVYYGFVPCEGDWLSWWHWLDLIGLKKGITEKFAGHINFFSRRTLDKLYLSAGFDIRRKRYSEHILGQILGLVVFFMMKRKSKKSGNMQINNEQYFISLGPGKWFGMLKKIVNAAIYFESLVFSFIPSPNTHWVAVKK